MKTNPFSPKTFSSVLAVIGVSVGLYLASLYHYLLFHSIAELFSIIIAATIFTVAWNARKFFDNNYFICVGVAYLFVAALDLVHVLAYKGMGVLLGYDANLATQIWVAARYMQALSLLVAPYFIGRTLRIGPLFLAYVLATSLVFASVFLWKIFPECFNESTGLTRFKTTSEYIVSFILLGSGVSVYRYRVNFDPHVLIRVLLSIAIIILSELTLTIYANVYDNANLVGHLFKILSFYLLYEAIVATGFRQPYKLLLRDLKHNEESLKRALGESKRREQQITALFESSKAVLKYRDFDESARTIIEQCKSATAAACGYISLRHKNGGWNNIVVPDSDGRTCHFNADLPDALRETREIAAGSGKAAYWNGVKSSEYSDSQPREHADIDNVLFAPLRIGDQVVGLLGIANKPGGFGDDDAQVVSAFAEIASIAFNSNRVLETLERSEEELRSIVQTAGDAIITIDGSGDIIFWNRSAQEIFGYSADEINGRSAVAIIPEKKREAHSNGLRRFLSSGKRTIIGKTVEMVGLKKEGREIPVELSLTTWQIRGESFFTAVIRDITKRKHAEDALALAHADLERKVAQRTAELIAQNERLRLEIAARIEADNALRESETKYRIVADNTSDWEWWLDPDGRFVYLSPSCQRITGRTAEEFISDPELINRIILPEDRDKFRLHTEEVDRQRTSGEVEFRIVRPDGSQRWISHVCQPVYDERGDFLGHRGSNRDTTARRLAEDALTESEKTLRALSEQLLTVQENERKRIALELHDGINQTLAAIKFALENKLTQMRPAKAPRGRSLESIIELVQHGIEETRRIQMDLRPSVLDDLGILATLSWFTREFHKIYAHIRIDVETALREEDVPEELKIVIFRIVQEAFNNISKHSRADLIRLSFRRIGDDIELTITDNGAGFDPANVRKGLGLTSMSERARLSKGAFSVESAPGTSTTIKATWSLHD